MTDDETFAEALRGAVRDMEPPPVPREEMWARIEQVRRAAAPAASPALPHRHTRWLRWSLPLAAALALGVALGRYTAADRDAQPAFVEASPSPAAAAEPALAYMVAAAQHLARTEELLSALPAEARDTAAAGVAAWATDLLTNTRLLMDSPASADPQLGALLRDLELILAQIAALPPAAPAAELQLIEDGIERNDMIGRLRAATNERPIFGT